MSNTNVSFSPHQHADQFRAQLEKLDKLGHAQVGATNDWMEFDEETEKLLRQTFGDTHEYVEAYAMATMAEAEALVNMPESAQESLSQDLPQKAFQQRRQLLHAVLAELER
jgi:F0F1-type ATP synthase alpha subunit